MFPHYEDSVINFISLTKHNTLSQDPLLEYST